MGHPETSDTLDLAHGPKLASGIGQELLGSAFSCPAALVLVGLGEVRGEDSSCPRAAPVWTFADTGCVTNPLADGAMHVHCGAWEPKEQASEFSTFPRTTLKGFISILKELCPGHVQGSGHAAHPEGARAKCGVPGVC